MKIHQQPRFSILFGSASHAFERSQFQDRFPLTSKEPFTSTAKLLGLDQLFFLKQTHSTKGKVITDADIKDQFLSFVQEGDYLISQLPKVGIGVDTADCLPIIFIDEKRGMVAIAHAGWRGSVDEIAIKTATHMASLGSDKSDLRIFFAPSAQPCCYEVQEDFLAHFNNVAYRNELFIKKAGRLYFNLSKFNQKQLELYGIRPDQINKEYNLCTICNDSFCSVRKSNNNPLRQMTVVSLR